MGSKPEPHVTLSPSVHRDRLGQGIEDCLVCLSAIEERLEAGAVPVFDRPERPLSAYGGDGS